MPENSMIISKNEYSDLVAAAQEDRMLRRILHNKFRRYTGIKHDELESICIMLGMIELKEDEE